MMAFLWSEVRLGDLLSARDLGIWGYVSMALIMSEREFLIDLRAEIRLRLRLSYPIEKHPPRYCIIRAPVTNSRSRLSGWAVLQF